MEQTRAINALAPFLALAKSATSPRAAADLISQATSAQNTYVFAELLHTPSIQNLKSDSQYANHYRLLEIFAWGTWQDYQALPSTLPRLNETQTHKLRLLSLLTLAAACKSSSQLTYSNLQSALSLPSAVALESLVTSAIYAGLITGTLNPAQQTVGINSVAPLRDLAPGSVQSMVTELDAWSKRCEDVLRDLEGEMEWVKSEAGQRARSEMERQAQAERARDKWSEGDVGSGAFKGRMGGDAMDVDSGYGGAGRRMKQTARKK